MKISLFSIPSQRNFHAAETKLAAPFKVSATIEIIEDLCLDIGPGIHWPVGLMDKASASGAGDSRFESWAGHVAWCKWTSSFMVACEAVGGIGAHGVVVSHPLSMREALSSIPSVSTFAAARRDLEWGPPGKISWALSTFAHVGMGPSKRMSAVSDKMLMIWFHIKAVIAMGGMAQR